MSWLSDIFSSSVGEVVGKNIVTGKQKTQQDFTIEVAKLNQDNEELRARMALSKQMRYSIT